MKCYFLIDTLLIINITNTNMDTLNQTNEILARINPKYDFNGKPVIVDGLLVPVEIWRIIIEFLGDFKSINFLSCVCTQLLGITTYFRYVNDVYNYIRAKNWINSGKLFITLPEEWKTYRICLELTQDQSFVSSYVPDRFRTYELYLASVKRYNVILSHRIPREFLTEQLLLTAIQNGSAMIFEDIPTELLTNRICLLAMKKFPLHIFDRIPKHLMTDELIQLHDNAIKNCRPRRGYADRDKICFHYACRLSYRCIQGNNVDKR